MYTVYGYPKTRSVRVIWALEEMALPYDYKLIDLKKGEHLSAEFKSLSPAAKIPLLQTEDGVISESAAIVTWLADKHGYQEFIPKRATRQRARFEQMMMFLTNELEQPLWTLAKHTFALPEEKRIVAMQEIARWEFGRAINVFAQLLGDNDYLVDNQFSVADIIAGHVLAWAKGNGIALENDNVATYAVRVLGRDGYLKARQAETRYLENQ